ncbi:hypothetical protein KIH86_06300 [Paenibacillus sp. HN-1]|uniref:hypothetical protein n=1 Tax=Paenibacillus TaxID=44249 RepID=UPI001CA96A29|nr:MULTISPECIES: hypothetical protein [Paenibacillus]MBY9078106.1 hypothetical protein [Paenibacillus sp. CGMCC 1.18879]MBY9083847.1 hypothetical protein [Paenibacillus sinensis]
MGYSNQTIYPARRVDDYLDLLNYAKQIGDVQWQSEILEVLSELTLAGEDNDRREELHELWKDFDRINDQLLALFSNLREDPNTGLKNKWIEEIWELKLQRIAASKRIQGFYKEA